jgi:hypothetical protein
LWVNGAVGTGVCGEEWEERLRRTEEACCCSDAYLELYKVSLIYIFIETM